MRGRWMGSAGPCSRRGVLIGLSRLAAAGSVALAACRGQPRADGGATVNVNPTAGGDLAWWIIGGQAQIAILEDQVLPPYKSERPQVKVTITSNASWNDHNTKLLAAMAGGAPPDVARVKDYWTPDYQIKGALVTLDPYINADKLNLPAKHGEPRLASTKVAGKTYALPFTTVTLHQFYNEELLKLAGFQKGGEATPPETWEQRRDMARKLTDRGREVWGNQMYAYSADQSGTTDFMQWAMQNGVEWMNKDLTTFTFNTPESIETLQYQMDLIWKDQSTIPPGLSIQNARPTGKVAMWMGGAWDIPGYRKQWPDFKFNTAILPQKKTRTLMLQANNIVMFKDSKQRDIAWTLLRHINKESSDLVWNGAAGYVPVALANFDKPPFSTDPAWITVVKQIRRPDTKPYPIVTNYQEMMNVIGQELVNAWQNNKTAKDALADAQRLAQALLDTEVARRK